MRESEPPSSRTSLLSRLFRIGRDSLCGGLFVDRVQALKFAMFENGNRPQAVIMVPGILELDLSGRSRSADHPASTTPRLRAA
jgi:hypothetical protein